MSKEIHTNSDGWKMVATPKGVSTFEPKSKLHHFLGYAPLWSLVLLLLPVFFKDPSAYWFMVIPGILFGVPLCWAVLHIPIFSVNRKLCVSGLRARWKTSGSFMGYGGGSPEYIYVFNQKKGVGFPAWYGSEKSDRDIVENHLSRFIPKNNDNESKSNS